jgi:hypothetical protein
VAQLLYALIRERALLPGLALAPWPEADALAADWWRRGEREAAARPTSCSCRRAARSRPRSPSARLDDDAKAQVHGGIFLGAAGEGSSRPTRP